MAQWVMMSPLILTLPSLAPPWVLCGCWGQLNDLYTDCSFTTNYLGSCSEPLPLFGHDVPACEVRALDHVASQGRLRARML